MRPLRLWPILLLCCGILRGQSIQWDPPGGSIGVNATTRLALVCRDCRPLATPTPPQVRDLILQFQAPESSYLSDNGVISQTITYVYAVVWPNQAQLVIPSFTVATDHGRLTVPEARFDAVPARLGNTGKTISSIASARLTLPSGPVWAGQVFPIEYRIQADANTQPDVDHRPLEWKSDPLVVEDWSTPEPFDDNPNGVLQRGLSYRTRGMAPAAGTYHLPVIRHFIRVVAGGLSVFGLFQGPQYEQFSVDSNAPELSVQPLPPAPAGFAGAVGDFRISSKLVPGHVQVHEPITWTLEISGTGNWPQIASLPARTISRDFQVVHPQVQRTPAAGKLFDSKLSEDIVLVPNKSGNYVLPAIHFVYFDPVAGQYKTISTDEFSVEVGPEPVSSQPAENPVHHEGTDAGVLAARSAELPHGLPRDPLPAAGEAAAPLTGWAWLAWLLVPLVLVGGYWLYLARRLAQRTDPELPRREARRRIAAAIAALRTPGGGPDKVRPLLIDWQREGALLWRIRHAAPSSHAFTDPAWASLWAEAEAALYSPHGELPPDWAQRAEVALAAAPAPRFHSRQMFLRRNLFPAVLGAIVLFAGSAPRAGADAASDYRAGRYTAAERAWREGRPLDPALRHDLSLALAQQNRWAEAAAQAGAAFAQDPSNPTIRGQFIAACERANVSPGPLAPFLAPGFYHRWVELASAPVWQRIAIAGAVFAAAGLALLLACIYGAAGRRASTLGAAVLLGIGLFGACASLAGWAGYGDAADEDAVWVVNAGQLRSIPTEADASQSSVSLDAGSIALVDKSFLGWRRLRFSNGETGWVRRTDLVYLWR